MAVGAAHPRVLGYLGRALSLELSAVQQYMTQASLGELWGEGEAAERLGVGAIVALQERTHKTPVEILGHAPAPQASVPNPPASACRSSRQRPSPAGQTRQSRQIQASLRPSRPRKGSSTRRASSTAVRV